MTDYIERDIWKTMQDDLPYKGAVKRVLIQAPAADVRPVVRGEWVQHQNSKEHMVCSVCNRPWHKLWCPNVMFAYCPNCGADMREENEG